MLLGYLAHMSQTTLKSLGSGASLVSDGFGPSLRVRSLTAGDGITITQNDTDILIDNTAVATTLTSAGAGTSLVSDGTGPALAANSVSGTTSCVVLTLASSDVNFDVPRLRLNGNTTNTATASGTNAIAMGVSATGSALNSIAIGNAPNASATNTIAIGVTLTVSGANAIGIGSTITSSGTRSIAIGNSATASGNGSIAIGDGAQGTATGAVALGDTTTNAVAQSFAFGYGGSESLHIPAPTSGGLIVRTMSSTSAIDFTVTANNCVKGLVICTKAGTQAVTLPTGTNMDLATQLLGSLYAGASFFCLFLASSGATTIALAGAGGMTAYGVLTGAAGQNIMVMFRRNGANAWEAYAY